MPRSSVASDHDIDAAATSSDHSVHEGCECIRNLADSHAANKPFDYTGMRAKLVKQQAFKRTDADIPSSMVVVKSFLGRFMPAVFSDLAINDPLPLASEGPVWYVK